MNHRSSGRLTRTTAWAVVLLMAGLLGACGSKDEEEPAPTITPPPGFTVVSSAKAGFAIAVPDNWIRLPLNGLAAYDGAAEKIQAQNPAIKDALDTGRTLIGRGVELFALDPTDNGATSANLLVGETPDAEDTLELTSKRRVDLLAENGATDIDREYVQLAGLEATKLTFVFPVPTAGGTRDVLTTQYILLREGKTYTLTLAGTGPDREAIVQSLRLA